MHRILLINCCHFLIDNKIVSLGNNYKDGVLASSARLLAIIGNPAEEGMALVKTMLKHLLTFVRPENCLLTRRERRSCCTCPSRLWRRRASSLSIKVHSTDSLCRFTRAGATALGTAGPVVVHVAVLCGQVGAVGPFVLARSLTKALIGVRERFLTSVVIVASVGPATFSQSTVTMVPPMPHMPTPLLIRMKPFSPQPVPQEFLISQ